MRKLKNTFERSTYEFLVEQTRANDLGLGYEVDKFKYVLERNYTPDFTIMFPSGHKRFIETKGYLRGGDIVKMVAIRRQHPEMDIRIFFQKDNKLTPKMRYSDWAEKYGFIYCVGQIPLEWFAE